MHSFHYTTDATCVHIPMLLPYFTGKISLLELPNAKDALSLRKMPGTTWNKWIDKGLNQTYKVTQYQVFFQYKCHETPLRKVRSRSKFLMVPAAIFIFKTTAAKSSCYQQIGRAQQTEFISRKAHGSWSSILVFLSHRGGVYRSHSKLRRDKTI